MLVLEFGVLRTATSEIVTLWVPLVTVGASATTPTSCVPFLVRWYCAATWFAIAVSIAAVDPDGGFQADHGAALCTPGWITSTIRPAAAATKTAASET